MAVSPILTIYTLLIISSASESFLKGQAETSDDESFPNDDDFFNSEGTPADENWFWQEGNGFYTQDDLIKGVYCRQDYCGSQAVSTVPDNTCTWSAEIKRRNSWLASGSPHVEGVKRHNERACGKNEWLAGWKCIGDHCANKMLICNERVYNSNHQHAGDICEWDTRTFYWTAWMSSDTDPTYAHCPDNTFAIGLACQGANCQQLRIKCAEIL